MNIFVLDQNPEKAAEYHCDTHANKMVLETAQLLSGVHRVLDGGNVDVAYKLSHKNHPCSIWARSSEGNYRWLWRLGIALAAEYTLRYGKVHKSEAIIRSLENPPTSILGNKELTPFAQAIAEDLKSEDAVNSYRMCYMRDKAEIAFWNKARSAPDWYTKVV